MVDVFLGIFAFSCFRDLQCDLDSGRVLSRLRMRHGRSTLRLLFELFTHARPRAHARTETHTYTHTHIHTHTLRRTHARSTRHSCLLLSIIRHLHVRGACDLRRHLCGHATLRHCIHGATSRLSFSLVFCQVLR